MKTNKAKKINIICKARLDKYRNLTTKALSLAKSSINPEKKKADFVLYT